jgi:hypothetical protein
LRAVDTSALPPELAAARARTLDRLHAYTVTHECPLNETRDLRVPVMIDSLGRHCPVAQLMAWDGQEALVREVARTANNILVRDLTDPRFLTWAHGSGLSIDELAAIQPAYEPVTRWKVAVATDGDTPTKDELTALPRAYEPNEIQPRRPKLKGALRGLDEHLTAQPIDFNGSTYIALEVLHGEHWSYQLRRWTGTTWERVATFPVPINALAGYDGRLYVGGGGHPFSDSQTKAQNHAFISNWDGDTWTRVPTQARGQVQAFATVRGHLCAAVTRFEWPT